MKRGVIMAIIAVVGAAIGVALVAGRKGASGGATGQDDDEGGDAPPGGSGGMFQNQDKAIAVGEAGDPAVAPLLAEMRVWWEQAGIDLSLIDPTQFYVMSKATHTDGPDPDEKAGAILAIASRSTWERTTEFVATVLQPILRDIIRRGTPRGNFRIGGFREGYGRDGKGTGSYNDVVGGAAGSRHVDADAADIIPTRGNPKTAHDILMAIAVFREQHPKAPIGFGAYGGNGHVDIGGRRHWSGSSNSGKAEKYIKLAKQELAVA